MDKTTQEYQGRHNPNVVQKQDTPTQYKWTFRWWLRRLQPLFILTSVYLFIYFYFFIIFFLNFNLNLVIR